jgi:hypothetical protein
MHGPLNVKCSPEHPVSLTHRVMQTTQVLRFKFLRLCLLFLTRCLVKPGKMTIPYLLLFGQDAQQSCQRSCRCRTAWARECGGERERDAEV